MPAASKKSRPKLHTVEEAVGTILDNPDMTEEQMVDVVKNTRAETNGVALVSIPFRGHNFTIPKLMDEWLTEACLAMSTKDYVLAAKLLLGPGQWAALQSVGNKRKDIQEFLVVFGDVVSEQCVG